jgi:DNA polymerase-3 subunit epsilon
LEFFMRYFIGDTETTGLKGAKAVEIAFIEIEPETLDVLGSWQSLIDPERDIEETAQGIHGITSAMVEDAPTIEEFVGLIGGPVADDCTLIGYNVQFDRPMFEPVMNIKHTWCALSLCRRLFPTETPNHRLGTMAAFLGLDAGEAHRAMADVLTVHQLLLQVLPTTGKTLLQHLAVPVNAVYTMPWGDHKGKLLVDVPKSYRNWLLSVKIDDDLRAALTALHKAGI